MTTTALYALTAEGRHGESLSSKIFIVAVILALLFAAMPVPKALAAPASDGGPVTVGDPELEWSNKLLHLRTAGFFYDHIRLYPADFENLDELSQARTLLEKYGFALKQANTIATNHTGFDTKGRVTNEIQAEQSLKDLAMYLHMMRGLQAKFEEQGYTYHLLK